MPPVTRKKSSKAEKEDAERQERILIAKEKVLKIKRNLLAIVEGMLEEDISKEWFLDNCVKLCHADYNDVIQERSIEHLCGYPLCANIIKQIAKQKYHISRVANKVYDLTERKCFCSNECYKASNYLKAQLSPIPLYMRKEEHIKVHLLSDCDNRGSAGEEIVFHHTIPQDEIEKVYSQDQTPSSLSKILEEEVKICADSLNDLKIKERVYENPYAFESQIANQKIEIGDDKSESDSNLDIDSDDSVDQKLFPDYDNVSILSRKQMPVPGKTKKVVLIEPLKPTNVTASSSSQVLSLDFVSSVFKDWMTEDTMKYLLGEKYVYGIKADYLFERMTANDPISPEKLSSIKNEYISLCLKIDSLPDVDDFSESGEIDFVDEPKERSDITSKEAVDVNGSTGKKIFKRKPPKKKKEKNQKGKHKSVTFSDEVNASTKEESSPCLNKDSDLPVQRDMTSEEPEAGNPVPEPSFPLVDSLSQNALRRQVLTSKLKAVYSDLLPTIGLNYMDIREGVKKFVETLSLTPTNVMYKPKEWKLISFILLLILTKTVRKDIYNESQFSKLCQGSVMPVQTNLLEVEELVEELISPENVLNIQGL